MKTGYLEIGLVISMGLFSPWIQAAVCTSYVCQRLPLDHPPCPCHLKQAPHLTGYPSPSPIPPQVKPPLRADQGHRSRIFKHQALVRYLAQLRQSSNDTKLRIAIIKLVLSMRPKPPLPKTAVALADKGQHEVKLAKAESDYRKAGIYFKPGQIALKRAKAKSNYRHAEVFFSQALLQAPWVARWYYDLSVVQEKERQWRRAVGSAQWYLLANPHARDRVKVEKRIKSYENHIIKLPDMQSCVPCGPC
ncbi:MAG: hypothetical protein ACYDB9_09765 [Gammaproteobacteria bacterium]